jgi:AcrR family transcriptional regulator
MVARDKGKAVSAKRGIPAHGGAVDNPARPPPAAPASSDPVGRLLDAAERLLIDVGHEGVTTRHVGKAAGLNHGLVHYYFGSMEELFLAVLERFTARLIVRQRAMYAADASFRQKWSNAMGFLEEDLAAGYPKLWLELQAMAWHRPAMRARIQAVHNEWVEVLTEAFGRAMKEYGLDGDPLGLEAIVTLVVTFNEGLMLERLTRIDRGHAVLLRSIDRWLASLEKKKRKKAK